MIATSESRRLWRGAGRTALVWAIALQSGFAQTPQAPEAQKTPAAIDIKVVSGEGAANNVGRDSNGAPTVKVVDEAENPIAGASVVFTLPADGPSGEFKDGTRTLIVSTDNKGMAAAQGLRVNMTPGRLAIHVNASYRGLRARTNITQFNMAVPGVHASSSRGSRKLVLWLAVAGGAAVVAAGAGFDLLGLRSSTNSPSAPGGTPPIGITTGSASVGPPR